MNALDGVHPNHTERSVTPKNSLAFPAVFRSISLKANSLAVVAKHRYQKTEQGRVKISDKTSELISKRPNNYQTSYDFWCTIGFHLDLWGNAFAIIRRDRFFRPQSLHIVQPWKATINLKNGYKKYKVEGYPEEFTDNQILHFKGQSLDGIIGLSPIQIFRQTLGLGLIAEDFQAKFYAKGTHSGGMVTMPEGFHLGNSEEQINETISKLRGSFQKVYNGGDNVGKIMMLEQGMDFKPLAMPLKDAEFIQSRRFQIAEVSRIYGVPLHKLSELDRATHTNIEHQGIEYVQDAVQPVVTRCEQEIDNKLLTTDQREQEYFKFNIDALIRADIKTRYEAYSLALGKSSPGWVDQEWVQEKEDMEKISKDKLHTPKNMTLADLIDQEE